MGALALNYQWFLFYIPTMFTIIHTEFIHTGAYVLCAISMTNVNLTLAFDLQGLYLPKRRASSGNTC